MFYNLQQPKSNVLTTFVQSHHHVEEMNQCRLIEIIIILLNLISGYCTFLITYNV